MLANEAETVAAEGTAPPTVPPPSSLPLGLRLGKDVSVGEYDSATGLTFVTRQRGRQHFHMGVNAVRLARTDRSLAPEVVPDVSTSPREAAGGTGDGEAAAAIAAAADQPQDASGPLLRTGAFTGLALFAEEAFFLVQRGALVVWELLSLPPLVAEATAVMSSSSSSSNDQPLDAAQFVALLLRDRRASLPCLHAYVALKENQFYPRRHASSPRDAVALAQQPQHYASGDGGARVPIAFDVWQSSTETVYVPNEDYKAALMDAEQQRRDADATRGDSSRGGSADVRAAKRRAKKDVKKRKVRRLALAFRVVVCQYADAAPSSACLLRVAATQRSEAEGESPVKLAVVDEDRSVLFFEIGTLGEDLK